MEPPQYTEYNSDPICVVNWDYALPHITPQKITPEVYQALLVLSKHCLKKIGNERKIAEIKKKELDHSTYTNDLNWCRLLWKIVHIFSASLTSLMFKFVDR